jgi:hypothetical protein
MNLSDTGKVGHPDPCDLAKQAPSGLFRQDS